MSPFAILLVTLSAFSHAFWNYLSKRQNPRAAFFLMASIASAGVLTPTLFFLRAGLAVIPPVVWGLIAATGAVQSLYYIFLAAAYRNGDLSHTYPLTRSLPVVIIAMLSVALGRGNQIHPLAYVGFAAVSLGCLILPLPRLRDLSLRHYRSKWVLYAVLAALCITAYTLLDDQSLRILRTLPETPLSNLGWALLFGELESISISFFFAIFLLGWEPERTFILHTGAREWKTAVVMGVMIMATYGLVLWAMAYAANVSYVFAFRQLSIPIGAALGLLLRKEPATRPKLAGIGLVVIGLILAAVG